MFYPPTIPVNFWSFLTFSILWGGVSFLLSKKSCELTRETVVQHVFTGLLGGLASLGLLTAFSFIPDDWSACRLSWSAGILRGYPLYSGESGPSNGFFYPPVGAWFYIPAAALGLISKSAQMALTFGWFMSLLCVMIPFCMLLHRLKSPRTYKYFVLSIMPCIFMVLGFVLALPQLRYLATKVHVDSPAFLFLGVSFVLALPISGPDESLVKRLFCSGVFFAFAAMSKQSIWPIVPVLAIGLQVAYGWKNLLKFAFGGATGTLIVCVCFLFLGESISEACKMVWYWPTRQVSITPILECLNQALNLNLPLLFILAALVLVIIIKKIRIKKNYLISILLCLFWGIWFMPFSILTRTKMGADSNHLALPSLFFLMAAMIMLYCILCSFNSPKVDSSLFSPTILTFALIVMALSLSIIPYFKTYCGWYLWCNNSHSQAIDYELHGSTNGAKASVYFPWQVLSTLIVTGKLYHIDDCLRYEESAGWVRSQESLSRFLPPDRYFIALRPFGASSYLTKKMGFQKIDPDSFMKSLPNWDVYSLK